MSDTEKQLAESYKALSTPESMAKFLVESPQKVAEVITGILASERTDLIPIAGRMVQSLFKFNLYTQTGRELKALLEKGKIKEDYFATHRQQATLLEFMKFIDTEAPDEELFQAVKSIFFTSISTTATEQESILAYQFLQICKQLESRDILVLKACYGMFTENLPIHPNNVLSRWIEIVADRSKLLYGMVELSGENLEKLRLISESMKANPGALGSTIIVAQEDMRLTQLGKDFCKFITNYS